MNLQVAVSNAVGMQVLSSLEHVLDDLGRILFSEFITLQQLVKQLATANTARLKKGDEN